MIIAGLYSYTYNMDRYYTNVQYNNLAKLKDNNVSTNIESDVHPSINFLVARFLTYELTRTQ